LLGQRLDKALAKSLSLALSRGDACGRSLTMVSMVRPATARSCRASVAASTPWGRGAYSLTVLPMKSVFSLSLELSQRPPGNDRRRALSASSAVVSKSKGAVNAGAGHSFSKAKPSGGWLENCCSKPLGSSWLRKFSVAISPFVVGFDGA
jgi:hypothetical protein